MRNSRRAPRSLTRKLLALALLALALPTASFAAPLRPSSQQSVEPVRALRPFTLPEIFSSGAAASVGGNLLVYSDCNEDDCYIRSWDLNNGQGSTLIENGPGAFRPATDGA